MSFAYPSNLPDPSSDDQLTITDMFAGSKSFSHAILALSVSICRPCFNFEFSFERLLFNSYFDFQERIPHSSPKVRSPARTPIGGQGIPTPNSPKVAPSSSNSMEEVSSALRGYLEKLLELSSLREKEAQELRS